MSLTGGAPTASDGRFHVERVRGFHRFELASLEGQERKRRSPLFHVERI